MHLRHHFGITIKVRQALIIGVVWKVVIGLLDNSDGNLGSLEEGNEADIIIVKLDQGIPIINCTLVKVKIVYETHSS